MHMRDALGTYLKMDRRVETNKQYRYVLGALAVALGTQRHLEAYTYEELLDYLASLAIAPSTRANYTSIIKTFFAWCVEMEYIERSPAHRLKVKKHPRPPNETRAIPPEELSAFVQYARLTSPRNYALLLFLADTGCRIGGLLSLTTDNLHLQEGCAWLIEKGGKWHLALFGLDTAKALETWLTKRPQTNHTYVWTARGPRYEPLKDNAVRYVLRTYSQKLGCKREWFPHALRHGLGYAWADAGVAPTIVQRKLGHSNPSITLDYYYPNTDERLVATSQRLALQALKLPDHERFAPVPLPALPTPKLQKTGS